MSEMKPEPSQTPKTESFATIGNVFWPLTVASKVSILDICGDLG